MNVAYEKITICLDMAGCPNRCLHCWLGRSKNKMLPQADLIYAAEAFEEYCDELTVYSWFREPDYRDDYKELWELENSLSRNCNPQRFELLSFWRLFRDKDYIEWLKNFDVKKYQLTFFGMEDTTDYYTGRRGSFTELIYATETLLENGFLPRWQVFAYHDNIHEIKEIFDLSKQMRLKERCRSFGEDFDIFIHQGSCDGEGGKLYENRLTLGDIGHIPEEMIESSMKHFGSNSIQGFLGNTESELMDEFMNDNSVLDLSLKSPVLFANNDFDVYPNFSERSEWFKLGNLKTDGAGKILSAYGNNTSFAQKTSSEKAVCDMAKLYGDGTSSRLFSKNDFRWYLLNTYCENSF